jgi:hypothetical protein
VVLFLWVGALPDQSASQGDLYVEDIETPCGQPTIPHPPQLVTNVHVQNIPPEFRNIGLKYYLEKLMLSEVTCKVEQFNADALAMFQPPIGKSESISLYYSIYVLIFICSKIQVCMFFVDINVLIMRSRQQNLPNGGILSLSPLLPSSTIIVSNLPQNTQDITLSSHFQRFSGSNTIIHVKLLSSNKALVTFVNCKCKFVELSF